MPDVVVRVSTFVIVPVVEVLVRVLREVIVTSSITVLSTAAQSALRDPRSGLFGPAAATAL